MGHSIRVGLDVFVDSARVLGPLTLAQVASIITATLSLVMWLILARGPADAPTDTTTPQPSPPVTMPSEAGDPHV